MKIIIINRGSSEFCSYDRYVDHRAHDVAYITIDEHLAQVPNATKHVVLVHKRANAGDVVEAAARCVEALGGCDRVLTLTEIDQLTAAELRVKHGAPGPSPELIYRFRDKIAMKETLSVSGVPVPRYRRVDSVKEVVNFATELGTTIVVKPRKGVASGGLFVIEDPKTIPTVLENQVLDDYEVEEYLAGPIWHADGVLVDGDLGFARAFRYLGTCHGFARGRPLGVVGQTGPMADKLVSLARRCVRFLGLTDGVFHFEAIQRGEDFTFMEVAARVGGAYLPYLVRDVYGVDLVREYISLQLDEPTGRREPSPATAAHAGGLVIPEAVGFRIDSRTSMLGTVPELYREMIPPVGHVFEGHGEYEDVLGTFLFRGDSSEQVEAAILRTIAEYRYSLEPVAVGRSDDRVRA